MNLYILMRICNKHYSFPSTESLTSGLMSFMHFKMSINVQVMPQMYIFLAGNLSTLSRVRRKQQIKERPARAWRPNAWWPSTWRPGAWWPHAWVAACLPAS